VDEGDVDTVDSEPLEALVEGAADAVAAEVPLPPPGGRDLEALVVAPPGAGGIGHEQPADLRRQHVLVARTPGQGPSQAALGEPQPVMRCGVESADAAVPRGVDRGLRLLVRNGCGEVADRPGPEVQLGEAQSRPGVNPVTRHLRMIAQTLLKDDLGAVTGQERARPAVPARQHARPAGGEMRLAARAAQGEGLVDGGVVNPGPVL
jgi:hypothetical protein